MRVSFVDASLRLKVEPAYSLKDEYFLNISYDIKESINGARYRVHQKTRSL